MSAVTSTFMITAGLLNMALAVILGAFGAHALKARIDADLLAVYTTGNHYHVYHALGLILLGILMQQFSGATLLRPASLAILLGIVLFSGSLYLLAVTGIRTLGAITPLGGLAFIAGWIMAALAILRTGT